jgi:hypothetical protein
MGDLVLPRHAGIRALHQVRPAPISDAKEKVIFSKAVDTHF